MSVLPFGTLAETPVPRDLPLPLPVNEWQLAVWIVGLFLLHIFFVNLMVGGSLLTTVFEIAGLYFPRYDRLASRIAETVTVNKSLAVVLGIGPLLMINLLYTTHFYAANALTGHAWALLIPLVTLAFLLTYLHKYTWDSWTGRRKARHIAVGVAASLLFLAIPLIFLTNINLMLFPDKWSEVSGFLSSLRIGNVFPRYFHFMAASLAVTGLIMAGWFGRRRAQPPEGFTRAELRRHFYKWAFFITLAQFVFGPLILFTLPTKGITTPMLVLILSGAATGILTLVLLRVEIRSSDERIGRLYIPILAFFAVIILFMGQGRHLYREASLLAHKRLVSEKTAEFRAIEEEVAMRMKAGLGAGEALTAPPSGKKIFSQTCAACHADVTPTAAPALVEIYRIYKDNPDGIVTWARAPGKKRPQYGQMPPFAQLGDEQLHIVAKYMLERGAKATGQPAGE